MTKPVKNRPAAALSRRFASPSFPAVSSVAAQHKTCRLQLGRRLRTCSVAAIVLLVCSNAAHAEPIAARPSGSVATTDRVATFVEEAARRFAIPSSWIRAVMQAESGGDARALSAQGAMGLMQIMPETWAALRLRYGLGTDPYDPCDNITAGAAYLREMHDRYGEPGFLAAYNAGPDRYEEHVATGRPLPSETVSYMSVVASLLDISIRNGTVVAALAAPSWAPSPLFVVRANAGSSPSRASSGAPTQALPTSQSVQTNERLTPHSEGLFASIPQQKGSR
jgi:soluble lytic murein transglycosylase-like protein